MSAYCCVKLDLFINIESFLLVAINTKDISLHNLTICTVIFLFHAKYGGANVGTYNPNPESRPTHFYFLLKETTLNTIIQGVPGGRDKTSGECSLC